MKKYTLGVVLCLSVLAISASAFAQTNLIAVRRADNTVWTKRCIGVGPGACDAWQKLAGMFSSQPVLTWDASIKKYLLAGVGLDGKTWEGTFDENGTFGGKWRELAGAAAASPPAIAAASPLARRVVTVDVNGGGNFTSPVDALASITTASATNPFLVKIMPGVYDVGSTPVQMKEYVDIEGSGELVTTITGAVDGAGATAAVVQGADNAQLRFVTVESTFATGGYNMAIGNFGVSPSLLHVRAVAKGAGALSRNVGVWNTGGAPHLNQVTVNVSGGNYTYGVYNVNGTTAVIENVAIEASGAVYNNGIRNYSGSATHIRDTTIHVSAVGVANPACETFGVLNNDALPVMRDVTMTVEGGQATNVGIDSWVSPASIEMATIKALGPGTGIGVRTEDSISDSYTSVNVSGASTGMEILANGGSGTATVDRSTFVGGADAVINTDGFTFLFGASKLGGARNTAVGTWTCVGSYTDTFTALSTTCN